MNAEAKSRAAEASRYTARVFLTIVITWLLILACAVAERAGLINDLAESSLRLAAWSGGVSLVIVVTWTTFPSRPVRYAVIVFSLSPPLAS